jgi:hypothetical protein
MKEKYDILIIPFVIIVAIVCPFFGYKLINSNGSELDEIKKNPVEMVRKITFGPESIVDASTLALSGDTFMLKFRDIKDLKIKIPEYIDVSYYSRKDELLYSEKIYPKNISRDELLCPPGYGPKPLFCLDLYKSFYKGLFVSNYSEIPSYKFNSLYKTDPVIGYSKDLKRQLWMDRNNYSEDQLFAKNIEIFSKEGMTHYAKKLLGVLLLSIGGTVILMAFMAML